VGGKFLGKFKEPKNFIADLFPVWLTIIEERRERK
jgi:hypothetical protein